MAHGCSIATAANSKLFFKLHSLTSFKCGKDYQDGTYKFDTYTILRCVYPVVHVLVGLHQRNCQIGGERALE